MLVIYLTGYTHTYTYIPLEGYEFQCTKPALRSLAHPYLLSRQAKARQPAERPAEPESLVSYNCQFKAQVLGN